MEFYTVIMENIENITFTLLFVTLFGFTLKQNQDREEEYRAVIKSLSNLDNLTAKVDNNTEKIEFIWAKIRDIQ